MTRPASPVRGRLLYLAIVAAAAMLPNPARASLEVDFDEPVVDVAPPAVPETPTTRTYAFLLKPGEDGARELVLTDGAGLHLPLAEVDPRWACALSGDDLPRGGLSFDTVSCGNDALVASVWTPGTEEWRARNHSAEAGVGAWVQVRGQDTKHFHFDLPPHVTAKVGIDLPDPGAVCDPTGDRVVDIDVSQWSVPHGHEKYETTGFVRVVSKRLGIDEKIATADDLTCSADQEDTEGVYVSCSSKTEAFARIIDLQIKDGAESLSVGERFPCTGAEPTKGGFRLPCGAQIRVRGWRNLR